MKIGNKATAPVSLETFEAEMDRIDREIAPVGAFVVDLETRETKATAAAASAVPITPPANVQSAQTALQAAANREKAGADAALAAVIEARTQALGQQERPAEPIKRVEAVRRGGIGGLLDAARSRFGRRRRR